MMLTLIIVWLALQIPLGALIGTCIEHGMVQPRGAMRQPTGAEQPASSELSPTITVGVFAG
jgi:hypothetical protein